MRRFLFSKRFVRIIVPCLASVLLACAAIFSLAAARPDNPPGDAVGAIDGEAIAVTGPMSVEAVRGQVKTILRSGSDVRVKSGNAHINLVEGGSISICGPAHFSVLKSGGSLTIALDTGILHAHIEREPALTVYTPQIQAQPVAIGDGPQDAVFGLETSGAMCLRATRGAVRIEQQLTGQSVLVPQGGDVLLINGQLDTLLNSAGRCTCDVQIAKATPPVEISRLATTEEIRKKALDDAKPTAPPQQKTIAPEEPVYQVFMPPLSYDAKTKIASEYDPKLVLVVRRVRVRPTLIFQGRVEGNELASATPPAAAPAQKTPPIPTTKPATTPSDSFVDRVKNYIHKLWTSKS